MKLTKTIVSQYVRRRTAGVRQRTGLCFAYKPYMPYKQNINLELSA